MTDEDLALSGIFFVLLLFLGSGFLLVVFGLLFGRRRYAEVEASRQWADDNGLTFLSAKPAPRGDDRSDSSRCFNVRVADPAGGARAAVAVVERVPPSGVAVVRAVNWADQSGFGFPVRRVEPPGFPVVPLAAPSPETRSDER